MSSGAPTIKAGIPTHLLKELKKRAREPSPPGVAGVASGQGNSRGTRIDAPFGPASARFRIPPGQLVENERLDVFGEDDLWNDNDGSSDEEDMWGDKPPKDDTDTRLVPNRVLDDFTIFNPKDNNTLISLELLIKQRSQDDAGAHAFAASGVVTAYIEDEEIRENDFEVPEGLDVTLPEVLDVEINYNPEGDMEIWIGTPHAWYILRKPSETYFPYFYSPFWKKHRLIDLMIGAATENGNITKPEFSGWLAANAQRLLKDDHVALMGKRRRESALTKLGRGDIEELIGRASTEIHGYAAQAFDNGTDRRRFLRIPLIFNILQENDGNLDPLTGASSSSRRLKTAKRRKRRAKRVEPVHLMPITGAIAKRLFSASFTIEKSPDIPRSKPDSAAEKRRNEAQYEKLKRALKNDRSHRDCEGADDRSSISLGGIQYKIGDFILVPRIQFDPHDPQSGAAGEANLDCFENPIPSQHGFMRIMGFYRHSSGWKFHGRILRHGYDTILQEAAHTRELFFTQRRGTYRVGSIIQRVNVRIIGEEEIFIEPTEEEIAGDSDEESETPVYMRYYVRYIASPEGDFLPLDERCHPQPIESFRCSCLQYRDDALDQEPVLSIPTGDAPGEKLRRLAYKGNIYREKDFVYIAPNPEPGAWRIAQILALGPDWRANVRWLGRHEDLAREANEPLLSPSRGVADIADTDLHYRDPQRLYYTQKEELVNIDDLIAVCHVQHEQKFLGESGERGRKLWTDALDGYYLSEEIDPSLGPDAPISLASLRPLPLNKFLKYGPETLEKELEIMRKHRDSTRGQKRTCFDLFCGAGGLSAGFEESGLYEVKWGLDINEHATKTFQATHPDARVYTRDATRFLRNVLNDTGPISTQYPRPGAVDLLVAGPPCQDFSGLNRFKSKNDQRKAMVAKTLACVEYFKPTHVVIENVKRILYAKLDEYPGGKKVKWGVHKFVLRSLTALGYNVHWKIYNSGNYGVPQERERLIYVAAKRGAPLPLPLRPTHAHIPALANKNLKLPYYDSNSYTIRSSPYSSRTESSTRGAPHYPITVGDAIEDLPRFDWKYRNRKHLICPLKPDEKAILEERRKKIGIPVFSSRRASSEDQMKGAVLSGRLVPYRHVPLNGFQRKVRAPRSRADRGSEEENEYPPQHITKYFSDLNVERVMKIPLGGNADHRSLPKALAIASLGSADSSGAVRHNFFPGLYGRVDPNSLFRTIVTDIVPSNKQGRCLHPDQLRVLTVRECARAQGFSDRVHFKSLDDNPVDMHRQIGNAVPVPLSRAVAESFRRSLFS